MSHPYSSVSKFLGKLQISPLNFYRFIQNFSIRKNSQIPPPIFQILSLRTLLVVSCPNYPSLQNYAVLDSPKRRRFAQNGVVLGILGFIFFIFEKKKEIKKKKREIGVASATPYRPYGGGRSHPRPLGVVRPPRKATKKKKKKKRKNGFGILGVAGPPPRAWGWLQPPPTTGRWWLKPPLGPWGWSGHPQNPKPIFPFFFFFFWPFGVAGPPPKAWGWLRPPPYGRYGVAPATPISSPFFFFFYF
jgi:hypothetical protein